MCQSSSIAGTEQALRQQQVGAVQQAIAQAKAEISGHSPVAAGSATAQAAQQATNTLTHCSSSATVATKTGSWFRPQVARAFVFPSNTAEVLSSPDEDGKLTVRFGIMKMTVGLEDIESLDGQKQNPSETRVGCDPTCCRRRNQRLQFERPKYS